MKKLILPGLLAIALLTGCSPVAPATTPSPTPTPETATPQQVASVLAQYQSDWREVVTGAGECRFTWTIDTSPTAKIKGMSCYLKEQTIGITSQLVMRDWKKLTIPSSMKTIVDNTSVILTGIAAIDLKTVCGTGTVPTEAPECNSALGSRYSLYSQLGRQLDAWSPYL